VNDGDGGYRISTDEVCAAVVPLVWLDSCAPSDPNASEHQSSPNSE
jgi:hypothetical protein